MSKTITIDPVTRIEGHAKITLQLDDRGEVSEAYFHVTQFRGFEKFCVGRPFYEMPYLMERICGICPVSHLLASAKACDALLAMKVPKPAGKLRRILNLAQLIQSHALSFFYLSAPDFILGMDADPKERNLFGLMHKNPELGRGGIRLRQFGQRIIETLAGKRIHPAWVVPGGVNEPLTVEKRDNPEIADKPVIIGGGKRGVVSAACYIARTFGVRSAMPSATAQRLCAELVFVKPRFDVYKEVSRQIREIFLDYTPLVEPLSLDEAYLDVTQNLKRIGSATHIAEEIRATIRAEISLTASAGVSYNKFLAKLASDHRKPDGLFVITPKMGPSFVETLPVRKFHGVGPATAPEDGGVRHRNRLRS